MTPDMMDQIERAKAAQHKGDTPAQMIAAGIPSAAVLYVTQGKVDQCTA
jgi:hypothetical protein